MSVRGRNVNLFLIDGEVCGCVKCTLANWTGVAYRIPRTELERCKDRKDLKQSGVYFLFGTSEETGESVVYVGQAGARKNGEGILDRLREHKRNPEKDYWTEAVVFTSSNNFLGPTEMSYLENRFCNLALAAGRYKVKNGNDPTPGNITEEKESEMEEFIEYARMIMGVLGHKVFEPKDGSNDVKQASPEGDILLLERNIKDVCRVEATGRQTAEGFAVLRGSSISPEDDSTIPVGIRERRKNAKIDENGMLQEDQLFSSPSSAAMFVIGKSANGLTSWKTSDGRTLKSLESEEVDQKPEA